MEFKTKPDLIRLFIELNFQLEREIDSVPTTVLELKVHCKALMDRLKGTPNGEKAIEVAKHNAKAQHNPWVDQTLRRLEN